DGDADGLAVVLRVQVEVRPADGLLDRLQERGVPGLDRDERGVGRREVAHLVERRRRAVVVDADAVQHGQGGPPGAHRAELLAHGLERRVHALFGVGDEGLDGHGHSFTMVPTLSPRTMRRRLPFCRRLYTMMGSLLSLQREIAVASMTLRSFSSTLL